MRVGAWSSTIRMRSFFASTAAEEFVVVTVELIMSHLHRAVYRNTSRHYTTDHPAVTPGAGENSPCTPWQNSHAPSSRGSRTQAPPCLQRLILAARRTCRARGKLERGRNKSRRC